MSETYADLSARIRAAGLMQRQYGYYFFKTMFTLALFVISVAFLLRVESFALQLLNAAFLAFVYGQTAAVFHDAAHQGILTSKKLNTLVSVITGNLVLLISADAWNVRHNAHHSAPNHEDIDGDIDVPLLAYTKEQAAQKRGIAHFIAKYQAFFWFFILTLAAASMRLHMTKKIFPKVFTRNWRYHSAELFCSVLGLSLYFGLIFWALPWWQAVLFIVVNNLATGLYLGTIFATNHKGMPIVKERLPFLQAQVLTTRVVSGHPVTDFWMGGLNYQIEHHLFPSMPRNNLSKASVIIKKFCTDNNYPYYETGFFRSYKEILQYLHEVSADLR